jgi:hypothetical protein
MIQRSLVEFDLGVVTAQFDNPSGIPVFPLRGTHPIKLAQHP